MKPRSSIITMTTLGAPSGALTSKRGGTATLRASISLSCPYKNARRQRRASNRLAQGLRYASPAQSPVFPDRDSAPDRTPRNATDVSSDARLIQAGVDCTNARRADSGRNTDTRRTHARCHTNARRTHADTRGYADAGLADANARIHGHCRAREPRHHEGGECANARLTRHFVFHEEFSCCMAVRAAVAATARRKQGSRPGKRRGSKRPRSSGTRHRFGSPACSRRAAR